MKTSSNSQAASAPAAHLPAGRARRGSALITVIMLTTIVGLIIASVLDWGVSEQIVNERHLLNQEVRNAAESALEMGISELQTRWNTQTSFTDTELAPGNNPLAFDNTFLGMYNGTNVSSDEFSIVGGIVPEETVSFYVDPNDPANQDDPHKGKRVFVRDVHVYATATASRPNMSPVTSYAKATFQLRDAPLFSHAVFYNMDLEFHPGPAMEMNGPVHANGDIYFAAVSSLHFHGVVTSSERALVGMKNSPDDWGSFNSGQKANNVYIQDAGGNWQHFYKGNGSLTQATSYYDSRSYSDADTGHDDFDGSGYANWREFASNRWSNNLQTGEHDTPSLNPVGYSNYVADDPSTPSVIGDDLNFGYAIIEPTMSVSSPNHKVGGETSKFSYKSGLNIRIHEGDPGLSHAVRLKDQDGNDSSRWVTFNKIQRETPPSGVPTSKMDPQLLESNSAEVTLTDEAGNPYNAKIYEVEEVPVEIDAAAAQAILTAHEYAEDGDGDPESSFFDKRRNKGLDLVELDMQEFRKVVDDTYDPDGDGTTNQDFSLWQNSTYDPVDDYNGIVYVEFASDTTGSGPGRSDKIVPADDTSGGLWVTNAAEIPDPDYNYNHASGQPRPNRDRGLTLATNNAMYVQGHFNADGDLNTGTNAEPDNASAPNAPAALAADSITVLSDNWDITKSKGGTGGRNAANTEFNAAILTGLVPSLKGGDTSVQSGGNHNFPRFLESWSGDTFRYRGSMVALFESELAAEGISTSYYSPPRRDWGFYNEFEKGNYPPGTPNVRSFRKVDYESLSRTEWATELANLPAEWDSIQPPENS
ncbi:MAG: hypothetical protein ACFB20_07835 [Opitutales bacterium]